MINIGDANRSRQVSRNLSLAVKPVDTIVLYGAKQVARCVVGLNRRNAAADGIVLFGKVPAAEGIFALIELEESFLIASQPQAVVFILDEIDDICRCEVETAAVRLYRFQHFAVVGNHHQTIARRGDEDVALTVAQGALDGNLGVHCRKVEAGIGQTAGSVIVAKDARAAYHQESAVVGLEIVFR